MSQSVNFGMVGLGRMGANIVRRLARHGITSAVYDVSPDAVSTLAAEGAIASTDMAHLASQLVAPRTIWIMVPAGVTDSTIAAIVESVTDAGTIIQIVRGAVSWDARCAISVDAIAPSAASVETASGLTS